MTSIGLTHNFELLILRLTFMSQFKVFCWMSKSPALLTLTGRNVWFNLIESPTYVYTVWYILSFECNFCNICWVLAAAVMVNGKAGHKSNIMLVCYLFNEVRRIVRPTDDHWAPVQMFSCVSEAHWEKFPTKFFEGKHSLGFWVNNH